MFSKNGVSFKKKMHKDCVLVPVSVVFLVVAMTNFYSQFISKKCATLAKRKRKR